MANEEKIMTNIKTITQTKYDKELRSFIDRLSKIKIDYKLNNFEQKMIDESGETALLYTICMMKVVMKENDTNVRKKMGIRINFYKYLKTLLEEEFLLLNKVAFNYLDSLIEIEKISEEEAGNYFMNFFVQGHDYIREHYYPEDSPFKDPEMIDRIIEFEDLLDDLMLKAHYQVKDINLGLFASEFERSEQKVVKVVNKWNKNVKKWEQSLSDPSKMSKKEVLLLMDMSAVLIDEYTHISDMINFLLEKYEFRQELSNWLIDFLHTENLLDKFNKENDLGIKLTVEDITKNKHGKALKIILEKMGGD